MFKKIIFFICTFFCTNPCSYKMIGNTLYGPGVNITSAPCQLTSQEIKIYNAIEQQYQNIHSIDEMEKFLQKNNVSSRKLYSTVMCKRDSLWHEDWYLRSYLDSLNTSTVGNFILKQTFNLFPDTKGGGTHPAMAGGAGIAMAIMIIGPAIIGIPALAIGAAMKKFMSPSTTITAVSSGLMGTGTLLSMPLSLITLGFATDAIEKKVKGIIYRKDTKEKQWLEIGEKENIASEITQKLKRFYPELTNN